MQTKNLVLGVGIFIVFMFLLHNGIRAFYDAPTYDDFCDASRWSMTYPERIGTNCTFTGELREAERACYADEGQPIYSYDDNGCQIGVKECDYCNRDFNLANTEFQKTVFIISIIVGILVLLVGFAVLSIEPVGSALMASGVGAIVYGTISNWANLESWGRFLLLLVAFLVLIWIALRLNSQKKKGGFWQKLGLKK